MNNTYIGSLSETHPLRRVEEDTKKRQRPDSSVKFVGTSSPGCARDLSSKEKDSHCSPHSLIKKEAQGQRGGLLGFWRQHISHLEILLQPIYWVTQKAASFDGGPESSRSSLWYEWPYDPAEPTVFEVSVVEKDTEFLTRPRRRQCRPPGLWSGATSSVARKDTLFKKQLLIC